jgi:hypothetical protein
MLSIVKMAHLNTITHLFAALALFPVGSIQSRGMREAGLGGAAIVDSISNVQCSGDLDENKIILIEKGTSPSNKLTFSPFLLHFL